MRMIRHARNLGIAALALGAALPIMACDDDDGLPPGQGAEGREENIEPDDAVAGINPNQTNQQTTPGAPNNGQIATTPSPTPSGSAAAVQRFLADNYGKPGSDRAPWFDNVGSIKSEGSTAVIFLYVPNGDGKEAAKQVCDAVSGFLKSRDIGLKDVRVVTDGNKKLAEGNMNEGCKTVE